MASSLTILTVLLLAVVSIEADSGCRLGRELGCLDDYGSCHRRGSYFAKTVLGVFHDRCTCSAKDSEWRSEVSYTCKQTIVDVETVWTTACRTCGDLPELTGNCMIGNKVYKHGEEYQHTACHKYRCSNGNVETIEEGCEVGGQCYAVGSEFTRECRRYYCQKTTHGTSAIYKAVVQRTECEDDNGSCHRPGSTFAKTVNGVYHATCTCKDRGSVCTQTNCMIGNKVYKQGEEYQHTACLKYRCSNGNVETIEEGCEVGGQCYAVGSEFTHECRRYQCHKISYGTTAVYKTPVLRTECEDDNGSCHRPGSTFAKTLHGVYRRTCTCEDRGSGYQKYTCTQKQATCLRCFFLKKLIN